MRNVLIFLSVLSAMLVARCGGTGTGTSSGLDLTFGDAGYVITDFSGNEDDAVGVAFQSDGKIVVGGSAFNSNYDFALARYSMDGELDLTFGTSGTSTDNMGTSSEYARSILIDSQDRILVAGYTEALTRGTIRAVVSRYTSSGSLDTSFGGINLNYASSSLSSAAGTAGRVILTASSQAEFQDMVFDDSSIVLAGSVTNDDGNLDWMVLKLTGDGAVDTLFGSNGILRTTITALDDKLFSITRLDSGDFFVAGNANFNGFRNIGFGKVTPGGSFDTSVKSVGYVTQNIQSALDGRRSQDTAYSIRESATTGKMLISGISTLEGVDAGFIAQYDGSGNLDDDYGESGLVTLTRSGDTDSGYQSLLSTTVGDMLLGFTTNASSTQLFLTRLSSTGILDTGFGSQGSVTLSPSPSTFTSGFRIVAQDSKKLLVGSHTNSLGNRDFFIARYQ